MSSITIYLPPEKILKEFPAWIRGHYKKALRKAVNKELVYEKHHDKERKSYGLTREGAELAKAYCKEH